MVIFLMLVVFLLVVFLLIVFLLVLILLILSLLCLLLLLTAVFLILGFWRGDVVVFAASTRRHRDVHLGVVHSMIILCISLTPCSQIFARCKLKS